MHRRPIFASGRCSQRSYVLVVTDGHDAGRTISSCVIGMTLAEEMGYRCANAPPSCTGCCSRTPAGWNSRWLSDPDPRSRPFPLRIEPENSNVVCLVVASALDRDHLDEVNVPVIPVHESVLRSAYADGPAAGELSYERLAGFGVLHEPPNRPTKMVLADELMLTRINELMPEGDSRHVRKAATRRSGVEDVV